MDVYHVLHREASPQTAIKYLLSFGRLPRIFTSDCVQGHQGYKSSGVGCYYMYM